MQRVSTVFGLSEDVVVIAFGLALYAALAQFSPNPWLSDSAFQLAYFAFPFLIFSIFVEVYSRSWPLVKRAWGRRNWKWISIAAGTVYMLFYIFATNTVSVPDPGVPIPANLSQGYVVFLEVYGPMAVWPDVEFYFPNVNLVGYFSVGNVLLLLSLAALTAVVISLFMQNVSVRMSSGRSAAASLGGAALASLSTNACCCCTPVLLPLLTFLFGGVASSAIVESLSPESPVSNLLVLATLGSLLTSVILSARNCSTTDESARPDSYNVRNSA